MSEALSFNFRVLRDDGKKLSGREVLAVLRFFVDHHRAPDGYRIEATSWQRKGKRVRVATSQQERESAMEQFWYLLQARGLSGLRLGAVKEDVL